MSDPPSDAPASSQSKLSRLKPSFSELSPEARLSLILQLRANRRVSKRPPVAAKKSQATNRVEKERKKKSDVKSLLASLTPEQALELLRELGEIKE